jgi:exodeoxyribonuclease-1
MVRLAHALRPEGINWPKKDEGYTSFRLELLTKANGIGHESAHDALSDVEATIAMARLVKQKQPKLYAYVFENRHKRRVAELLDIRQRKPFLHVSSRLPRESAYTALMIPLCMHPANKNAVLAFNLSSDPRPLLELDADAIKERVFTAAADLDEGVERIPLKAVHINRCPVVATAKLLDSAAAARLGIDITACQQHWEQLKTADMASKLTAVFSEPPSGLERDAEAALYDGFASPGDKALFARVRQAPPAELAVLQSRFQDKRYRELLFRYRARYYHQSLSPEEAVVWDEQRYQRLAEPAPGRLTLDEYFARIDELEKAEMAERNAGLLDKLREWGDQILCE